MGLVNKISAFSSLLKAKILRNHFPLLVSWNITNRCNLRCKYCCGDYYAYSREELTTDEILFIIDQLAKMGTQVIALSGGESLVRDDIGEIIQHIKSKRIECRLTSNGILVPEKISEIKGLDCITISLDGYEHVHDKYRGKGSYQKAIYAIQCAKKNNIPLHVSTVLTKANLQCLDWLFEQSRDIGFLLQISPLYHSVDNEYDEHIEGFPQRLTKDEYKYVIHKILSYIKKGYPVFYSSRNYLNILNWPADGMDQIVAPKHGFKHIKCYAGRYFCTIEADGDMYPCVPFSRQRTSNCVKLGVKQAFTNIVKPDCVACI